MSEKAYIVSRGAYSDYRVVAVFTEKEKADEYAEQANDALNYEKDDYNSLRVEKKQLNPEPSDYKKYAWAEVNKDGSVAKPYGSRNIGASGTTDEIHESYKRTGFFEGHENREPSVTVSVEGHDTDKAVRKAKEIAERAQEEDWWGDDEKLREVLKDE